MTTIAVDFNNVTREGHIKAGNATSLVEPGDRVTAVDYEEGMALDGVIVSKTGRRVVIDVGQAEPYRW